MLYGGNYGREAYGGIVATQRNPITNISVGITLLLTEVESIPLTLSSAPTITLTSAKEEVIILS